MKVPFTLFFLAATLIATRASATVTCSVSTSGVVFGGYGPISGTPRDTNGTIIVTCSGAANESVSLSLSLTAGGGSYSSRTATSLTASLGYNLYTDPSRSVVWGDGTSGTSVISDSTNLDTNGNLTRNYSVYGRIPAAQTTARAGTYSDLLVITLNY